MASRRIVGLHKHPGSSFLWLTVVVPLPLRKPFHEGRCKYRMSLGTTDPAEARALALAKHAEFASRFQREKAQLAPAPQASIGPELADLLAQRASVRILALDDAVRYDPKLLRSFLATWAPKPIRYFGSTPAPEAEASDGMTPVQLAQLTRLHDSLVSGLSQALTLGQIKAAEIDCAAEAAKLGLAFDWSKNRPSVLKMARATLGAWLQVVARNHGAHVETPAMPEPASGLVPQPAAQPAKVKAGKTLTLWDLCDLWGKEQTRDAQGKMRRALDKLEASGCPMDLDTLTVDHGHDFKDHIRATMRHATSKTQSDVLANVKALLNFAVKERRLVKSNPWASVTIPKGKPTNRRGTWADEDLTKLFAAPLFQSYELPEDRRAGGPAAYWLPLLALHGGLRIPSGTSPVVQVKCEKCGLEGEMAPEVPLQGEVVVNGALSPSSPCPTCGGQMKSILAQYKFSAGRLQSISPGGADPVAPQSSPDAAAPPADTLQ